MKHCTHCKQLLGESVAVCPSCGIRLGAGLERIDDYSLLELVSGLKFNAGSGYHE